MVTITMTEEEAKNHFSALPKLYTVEDVALEYHTSERHILDEIKFKKISAFKIAGEWKMTAANIVKWIDIKKETSK